jgi:ribonucleotide monophosphatase NagD (HAD superfamily)
VQATTLVGDRPSTDGLMAKRLRVPFVLVLSGVTTNEDASGGDVDAAEVAPNLAAWVAAQQNQGVP